MGAFLESPTLITGPLEQLFRMVQSFPTLAGPGGVHFGLPALTPPSPLALTGVPVLEMLFLPMTGLVPGGGSRGEVVPGRSRGEVVA